MHFNRRGTALERVGSPEYFINCIMIGWVVFYHENIAFQGKNLLFRFTEEVLEQFLIVDIQIITHNSKVYTLFLISQGQTSQSNLFGHF